MYIEFCSGQPLPRTSGQSYYKTIEICTRKIADSNLGRDTSTFSWISSVLPGYTRRLSTFKYATTVSFKILTYSPFTIIFPSRHYVPSVGKTAPLKNQCTITVSPKLRQENPLSERPGKADNLTLGRSIYKE
jgi:hypothetical protein